MSLRNAPERRPVRGGRRIAVTFPNESRPRHERTTTQRTHHKRSGVFVGNVASTAMASYSISDSVRCLEGVDYDVVKVSTKCVVLCLFGKPKTFGTRPRRARKRTDGRHVSIGRLPNEHTNFKNIPTIYASVSAVTTTEVSVWFHFDLGPYNRRFSTLVA